HGDAEFPTGILDLRLDGLRRGTLLIPSATLAAHGTRQRDGVLALELDRHTVRTADGRLWSGPAPCPRSERCGPPAAARGAGRPVGHDRTAIAELRPGTGTSELTADATFTPSSGDLAAKLTARDVSVALVDPRLAGTAAADVDVKRTGGTWSGTATVDAQ